MLTTLSFWVSTTTFLAEPSTALVKCTEHKLFVRCVSHRGRGSCACDFSIVDRKLVLSFISTALHIDTTAEIFTIDRRSSLSTHRTVQCNLSLTVHLFSDKDREMMDGCASLLAEDKESHRTDSCAKLRIAGVCSEQVQQ